MKPETLLRLYPRPWRERYGDEFVALLEKEGTRPGVVLNVLTGAVDAWLSPRRFETKLAGASLVRVMLSRDEYGLAPIGLSSFLVCVFAIPWGIAAIARFALSATGSLWWIETFTHPAAMIGLAWAAGIFWRLRYYSFTARLGGALLTGGPMWLLAALGQLAR